MVVLLLLHADSDHHQHPHPPGLPVTQQRPTRHSFPGELKWYDAAMLQALSVSGHSGVEGGCGPGEVVLPLAMHARGGGGYQPMQMCTHGAAAPTTAAAAAVRAESFSQARCVDTPI
jgi:hypothetical protein